MARTLTTAFAAALLSLVTRPLRLPAFAPAGSELISVTPPPAACAAGAAASTAIVANAALPARLKPSIYTDPLVAVPSRSRASHGSFMESIAPPLSALNGGALGDWLRVRGAQRE